MIDFRIHLINFTADQNVTVLCLANLGLDNGQTSFPSSATSAAAGGELLQLYPKRGELMELYPGREELMELYLKTGELLELYPKTESRYFRKEENPSKTKTTQKLTGQFFRPGHS